VFALRHGRRDRTGWTGHRCGRRRTVLWTAWTALIHSPIPLLPPAVAKFLRNGLGADGRNRRGSC
jgi:hypothetical protein